MYQLNPAPLDSDNNKSNIITSDTNKGIYKKTLVNKTYKNKMQQEEIKREPKKINNLSLLLTNVENDDDNDDNNYKEMKEKSVIGNVKLNSIINEELKRMNSNPDNNIEHINYLNSSTRNLYSDLNDSYKTELMNIPNINMYNKNDNMNNLDNNKLLKKLDYIIHLLEEQQDEKTNHISEELILYLFLGIFIIFVLDSFANVGKYVR